MIKVLIWDFSYTPATIDTLFVDEIDYHGLIWLYNIAMEQQKQIKDSANNPKTPSANG